MAGAGEAAAHALRHSARPRLCAQLDRLQGRPLLRRLRAGDDGTAVGRVGRVLTKIRDACFRRRSGNPTRPQGYRLLTQGGHLLTMTGLIFLGIRLKVVGHRRMLLRLSLLMASLMGIACSSAAWAAVGQRQLVTTERTASSRDAQHRNTLRITVWYPAASDAHERPLVIGPPDKPLYDVGTVAPNAVFERNQSYPVIMLSHGFGGTARMIGWFGVAMARDGYIVIAVDHPGNNGTDMMTMTGAVLWWDRADDLRTALDEVSRDPVIGPHLDTNRVGAAGFSAGGFAALVAAGAKVDPTRWIRFCRENPDDGDCQPNEEFAATFDDQAKALNSAELAVDVAQAGQDHA